jgi:hypothetical protein
MRIRTSVFLLLALATFAQQVPAPASGNVSSADQVQVQETLQRYMAAYAHKSFQELSAVWPDVVNQKKEAKEIKHHMEDGNVTHEQMSLQLLQTDPATDGALVKAERTEQFVKTERTSTISHGDLNMGNMPVQDPGPSQVEKTKSSKKTDTVWFKLRKSGDSWTIVSITSQKPL